MVSCVLPIFIMMLCLFLCFPRTVFSSFFLHVVVVSFRINHKITFTSWCCLFFSAFLAQFYLRFFFTLLLFLFVLTTKLHLHHDVVSFSLFSSHSSFFAFSSRYCCFFSYLTTKLHLHHDVVSFSLLSSHSSFFAQFFLRSVLISLFLHVVVYFRFNHKITSLYQLSLESSLLLSTITKLF